MYTCKNLTANQTAIASKLGSHSLIRVHQGNTHRLSGRHRRQASSHSLIQAHPKKMVGCQAAIAGKPAPTV